MNAGGKDDGCDECWEICVMRLARRWAAAVMVEGFGCSSVAPVWARGKAFPSTNVDDTCGECVGFWEFEFRVYIVLKGISYVPG